MELDPNDDIYQQFINSFQQSDLDRLFADDDPNDKDYNVYQDIGNLDDFKEFLDIFDETFKNTSVIDNNGVEKESDQITLKDEINSNSDQHSFSNDQLNILYYQLNFHIQLLTQDWILSIRYDDDDNKIHNGYREMLDELNELSQKNDTNILRLIPNLQPSIQLVEHDNDHIVESENKSNLETVLTSKLKSFLLKNRNIFPFEWALPSRRFLSHHKVTQTLFTEADDHMIAFGLQKFYRERSKSTRANSFYKYIHNHFLPNHSEQSIRHHVKYLKHKRKIDNDPQKYDKWFTNPIVYYFRENKLPPFNRYFTKENLSDIYRLYPLPNWYHKLVAKDDPTNLMLYIDDSRKNNRTEQSQQTKCNEHSSSPSSLANKYQTIMPKPDSNGNLPLYELNGQRIILADGTIMQNILANQSFPFCTVPNLPQRRRQIRRKTKKQQSYQSKILEKDEQEISKICSPNQELDIDENSIDIDSNQPVQSPTISVNKINENGDDDDNQVFEKIEIDNNDDDDEQEQCENVVQVEEGEEEEEIEDDDVDNDDDGDGGDDDDDDDDDGDETEMLMNMDDEEDLMALMEASWTTVANSQHGKPQQDQVDVERINRRKSELLAMQRESSRFIVENSSSNIIDSINDRLISYYLKRSRKLLVQDEDYIQFLELISNLNDQPDLNRQIYHQLRKFLLEIRQKYIEQHSDNIIIRQQILDGFDELIEFLVLLVMFSTDRFDNNHNNDFRSTFEYLLWRRILQFFGKLELYLSFVYDGHTNQQQNCIQKIIRLLNQSLLQQKHLSTMTNEQRTKIKTSVSKILNNHPLLMKEFCSLFLEDPPSNHLYNDDEDFDEFIIPSDIEMENNNVVVDNNDNDDVENCTIPIDSNDLKYGTNECPCIECHQQNDSTTASHLNNHCTLCSIRFISGRIYLPQISTNKRLQLVEYVQRKSSPLQKINQNELESNMKNEKWTLEEDRLLLQTFRSMIVDFNITKLTENIIDSLSKRLANENVFNQKRNISDIAERLKHLIEILTG
ncbi:uncharacterized protein LOC113791401 [Dermatophagoides pteronyssinus]|uniref:uncharacterized protein LOC113791401 n=1 Tax=Dermatophagoides pteronyssinus TaxID=6956 RepID=UPI003F6610BF